VNADESPPSYAKAPDDRPVAKLRPGSVLSAALVVAAMGLLYWRFHGEAAPDWAGYEALYGGGGAWLLAQGRDPVFVWLLQASRAVLGDGGYASFRAILFALFTAVAAWVAFITPPQRRLGDFAPVAIALMVVLMFLLKGLAQIREGLAFVAVLLPVVSMFAFQRRGVVRSGLGAALAAAIHFGAAIFIAVWAVAGAQAALARTVLKPGFQRLLLIAGVGLGLGAAFLFLRDGAAVRFILQDHGVDTSASPVGGPAKYAYWLANGAMVLVIRRQLLDAAGPRRFGFLYAGALGSFVAPLLYALTLFMVFTGFAVPALTSMVIRLLFTVMELSLAVVMLRGRATWLTVLVTVAMIADRVRLLGPGEG